MLPSIQATITQRWSQQWTALRLEVFWQTGVNKTTFELEKLGVHYGASLKNLFSVSSFDQSGQLLAATLALNGQISCKRFLHLQPSQSILTHSHSITFSINYHYSSPFTTSGVLIIRVKVTKIYTNSKMTKNTQKGDDGSGAAWSWSGLLQTFKLHKLRIQFYIKDENRYVFRDKSFRILISDRPK